MHRQQFNADVCCKLTAGHKGASINAGCKLSEQAPNSAEGAPYTRPEPSAGSTRMLRAACASPWHELHAFQPLWCSSSPRCGIGRRWITCTQRSAPVTTPLAGVASCWEL